MNGQTKKRLIGAAWTVGAAIVASMIWVLADGEEKTQKLKQEVTKPKSS